MRRSARMASAVRMVSIHAPAWRATAAHAAMSQRMRSRVSIHAPAWRATSATLRSQDGLHAVFRSTPPHGGRLARSRWPSASTRFRSTPPHGGRRGYAPVSDDRVSFDPRPRMEGDLGWLPDVPLPRLFRSTPPHGGRPAARAAAALMFRSTPPHGGRHAATAWVPVSIHAPAWRATTAGLQSTRADGFDPRPRMEGDACARCAISVRRARRCRFRSTPPHGGRPAIAGDTASAVATGFDPRPRMEGDAVGRSRSSLRRWYQPSFDPRPRMEGDASAGRPASCNALTVSIHAPAWRATPSWISLYIT